METTAANIMYTDFIQIIQFTIAGIAASLSIMSVIGAIKAGVLKKVRFGSLEIESTVQNVKEYEDEKAMVRSFEEIGKNDAPYEVEQLAKYYSQILNQSKVSFWFSLIFASLGFLVIIIAVVFHNSQNTSTTVASFIAGVIIDSVSALFFTQSKNAQKSMGDFFDKLRNDHQQMEARNVCGTIENSFAKDAVNIQLALYFAQIENSKEIGLSIIEHCLKDAKKESDAVE